MIAGLLLAAGRSSRFGGDKLAADLDGRTVVRASLDAIAALDEVIVVTHGTAVLRALAGARVRFVDNPERDSGMATSISAGIRALDDAAEAVVIALGDQPFAPASVTAQLVDCFRAEGADIVVPSYVNGRGHPVLFARTCFSKLRALSGDEGARQLIESGEFSVARVAIEGDAPLDVDTPAALALAAARATGDASISSPRVMHPRLAELLTFLEAQRDRVRGAANRLPRDRWGVRPSPDTWSVAQVIWHLQRVESGVAKLIRKRAIEARASGHPEEDSTTSLIDALDGSAIQDRSKPLVAPPQVAPPEPLDPSDVEHQLEESREMLRSAIADADGLALGSITHPHPVLGEINLYQWILFVGHHEARHASQIAEVADAASVR